MYQLKNTTIPFPLPPQQKEAQFIVGVIALKQILNMSGSKAQRHRCKREITEISPCLCC